jgi:tetratricopeptide (TPR) repeat protein
MSVSNLASVLQSQGKYEQAEEMNRRALEGYEKALGKEHPDTLTCVYCLAYLLHQRDKYKDALILYQRAYTGYQQTLGPDHPTTKACSKHYVSLLEHSRG